VRLLKPGGRLGYICSSTFFRTRAGKALRRFLLEESEIETVVDFGDFQVFGGVTTYPAIITLRRVNGEMDGHNLRFLKAEPLPGDWTYPGFVER
jgi:type I restriction-modification system DNA methylase subunit